MKREKYPEKLKKMLDFFVEVEYYIRADFVKQGQQNGEVAELAEGARLEIV